MSRKDSIKGLMDKVREMESSNENKRRRDKWDCIPYTARDQWRGLPKVDYSCCDGNIPIQIDMNNILVAIF